MEELPCVAQSWEERSSGDAETITDPTNYASARCIKKRHFLPRKPGVIAYAAR